MRRRNLSRHRILGARADGTGRPGQPLRREWAAHVRTNAARHRLGTVPTGGLDTRASMASSRRLLAGSSQTPTPPASKRAQLSGGPQLSSIGRRTAACRNRCRTPHTARCSARGHRHNPRKRRSGLSDLGLGLSSVPPVLLPGSRSCEF